MTIQSIQQNIPLGSLVSFSLHNGQHASGILQEIGRSHVVIEKDSRRKRIQASSIDAWNFLEHETGKLSQKRSRHPRKELRDIVSDIHTQISQAAIEISPPNFHLSPEEIKYLQKNDAFHEWELIQNRYEYAQTSQQLGPEFEIIQVITHELQLLSERFPNIIELKRQTAYCFSLSETRNNVIAFYIDIAISSHDPFDWFNVAAIAVKFSKTFLAYYGLEQFFAIIPLTERLEAWYFFISLLRTVNDYTALDRLYESSDREFSDDEKSLLLETEVYLLTINDSKQHAEALVRKWKEGESPEVLIPVMLEQLNKTSTVDIASTLNPSQSPVYKAEFLDDLRSFDFLHDVKPTITWLEEGSKYLTHLYIPGFSDLNARRLKQLQNIFETVLVSCKQLDNHSQQGLCGEIQKGCQTLLSDIEDCPDQFSLETIYRITFAIYRSVTQYMQRSAETLEPQLELWLAKNSYEPDSDLLLAVQVVVENRIGRSSAESLQLCTIEDKEFFTTLSQSAPPISVAGGEKHILTVPLRITERALQEQSFSLDVSAHYQTCLQENRETPVQEFSVHLAIEREIENPYADYAEGGTVDDPEMFYGRDEFIRHLAGLITASRALSKSFIIFGQKRSGKSSILYHLRKMLEKQLNLLVLDLGNMGSVLDENASVPLLYQILWKLLTTFRRAIEDRAEEGLSPLNLSFPAYSEFYNHPSPLMFFHDIFHAYRRAASKREDWQHVRIVILIDEFTYLYSLIVAGKMPDLFMKNWKALLQEHHFHTVLVGQDFTPTFKQNFPNEFGMMQDVRVNYLAREDAIRLIDEPIRVGGKHGVSRYREGAIAAILFLTAGNPFYIQLICNRLVEYINQKQAPFILKTHVEHIKKELIQGINSLERDKFDNLISSGDPSSDAIPDEDALEVLKSIAQNTHSGFCHRDKIICKTELPIDMILDDLVKRDVLERNQQFYQIRVGLFKAWLLTHF